MADSERDFFRKQPKQSRSRSVVNAILSAAEELLERSQDPDQVSLQGVAARAGVGIGSLYDYFANRDGLLGAFLARLTDSNFEKLEQVVASTGQLPFDEALPLLVAEVMRTYLERPAQTRATITTIMRLGWVRPVIVARDRFAELCAQRLLLQHPHLDRQRVQLASLLLCDSIMGVITAELWRERDPSRDARVRDELLVLVRARVADLLAAG